MSAIVFQTFILESCLCILALWLGPKLGIQLSSSIRFNFLSILWSVLGTLPLIVAMLWSIKSESIWVRRLREKVLQEIVPLIADCQITELALISLFAGIGEEALFRGVLLPALTHSWGLTAGLFISSLLFGLVHPICMSYVLAAASVGLYLGFLFHLSGNLLTSVMVHALYDFVALIALTRIAKKKP